MSQLLKHYGFRALKAVAPIILLGNTSAAFASSGQSGEPGHYTLQNTAGRRFREYARELLPASPICNAPCASAVLEVDGRVRPSFFRRKVDSVSAHSLESAINSEAVQLFRKTLDVLSNSACRRCVCSRHYRKGGDAE